MSSLRVSLVFGMLAAMMIALLGRVAYLQTLSRPHVMAMAERQQHQVDVLRARRGSIFDRNGLLLAGTIQTQAMFIDPKLLIEHFQQPGSSLIDLDHNVEFIAQRLNLDPLELLTRITERPGNRYVRIADHVDESVVAELRELSLPGIGFEPTSSRVYPMGNIAAHVLGGMQRDQLRGLEGVELRFNELLSGRDGFKRSLKDSRRRAIAVAADDYRPAEHGKHLVLTIDANIQSIIQQELEAVCREFNVESAEAVVMDPRTGDVVALANWPFFSPQHLEDSTPERWRNRAIVDPYEPGSTIKPFIVGPALAWRAVRATDVFPINGPRHRTSYGRTITDVHPYPKLSVWDVLVKSSNVGMVMLVDKLGNARLADAMNAWGFGKPTGIELPGEDPGLIVRSDKWTKFTPDSMAQGYEMMITPLQLARGMCAYANGGKLVRPSVIKGTLEPTGEIRMKRLPNEKMPQVLDPASAMLVRRILADVMVRGTGNKAKSPKYVLFGKTGTAHRAVNGSYNESNYTASFVGGAPYEDPRLVIAVVVHNPDKSKAHFGGIISAPAAQRMLDRSLEYLNVPPSPALQPPPESVTSTLHNYDPKLYRRPGAPTAPTQDIPVHD